MNFRLCDTARFDDGEIWDKGNNWCLVNLILRGMRQALAKKPLEAAWYKTVSSECISELANFDTFMAIY